MRIRDRVLLLAVPVLVGCGLTTGPTLAFNCIGIRCAEMVTTVPAPPPAAQEEEEEAPRRVVRHKVRHKPIRPAQFSERPAGVETPAQTTKTDKGRYARTKYNDAKSVRFTESQPQPPESLPVVLSPEAALALAMQHAAAQAQDVVSQVRMVDADQVNDIDRTADTPPVPQRVQAPVTVEPSYQLASSDVTGLSIRTPDAAPTTRTAAGADQRSWVSRLASWLSDTLATLSAAIRTRFA